MYNLLLIGYGRIVNWCEKSHEFDTGWVFGFVVNVKDHRLLHCLSMMIND